MLLISVSFLSGITLQAVVRPVDYMSLTHRSAAAVLTAAWALSLAICVPMLWHVDMQLCWRNNPAWLEVLTVTTVQCLSSKHSCASFHLHGCEKNPETRSREP